MALKRLVILLTGRDDDNKLSALQTRLPVHKLHGIFVFFLKDLAISFSNGGVFYSVLLGYNYKKERLFCKNESDIILL